MKFPYYAKVSLIIIGLFTFVSILYIAQHIIVPLIYATIVAIMLTPLVDFFMRLRLHRVLAITFTLLLAITFLCLLIIFLFVQTSRFSETFPILIDKFDYLLGQCVAWASDTFGVSSTRIHGWIHDLREEIAATSKSAIGETLVYTGNMLVIVVLIPVYIFMILYYQPLLIEFIHRLFSERKRSDVDDVLVTTKRIIRSYLAGLLSEAFIIATLYSATLFAFGIEYAILLGIIGAILNVVPYIGGTLAVSLPFVIALTTKPSVSYAFLMMATYIVIQFIDNHYIVPKVVASKVKLNALVSVVVVIAGSMLWGIPGMLVSIPLTGIVKVLCDHIEALKPWGFLLGDTMPPILTPKFFFRKRTKAAHTNLQ